MSTHRTIVVIAGCQQSDNDYEYQLQQDGGFAYSFLQEKYDNKILPLLESQQIDGILLELYSPLDDRFHILRQLKQQMGEHSPPVVVIGSGEAEVAAQAFKSGAVDYLVKDRITPNELRLAMDSAIANAELQRKLLYSQQQFQVSVENMLDCFGIFSSIRNESGEIIDFCIDYLNAAACKNSQIPKEMQIGSKLCQILPTHHKSGMFAEYCRVVETGEPLIKDLLIYEETCGGQQLVQALDIRASKLNDGFVASWRDITEYKRLESQLHQTIAALQQQQYRVQHLIEKAPIGICIASVSGEVTAINDAMLHLHGCTRQEFEQQGINWRNFIPPEFSKNSEQALKQVQEQGFFPPQETQLLHQDGTRLPILLSATQWIERSDEHLVFAMDLTPQKQAQAAIEQLNRELANRVSELQTLLDIIPVGIAIATDPTCVQMHSNAYIRQLLGVPPANKISKSAPVEEQPPYRVFQSGQEIASENLPMQVAARLGVDVRDTEFEILLSDGTVRHLLAYATPLRGDNKEIRGAVGAFLDITERIQTEIALRQSEERFRNMADNAPIMVWMTDAAGKCNYLSKMWYEYTGQTETTGLGFGWLDALHPQERELSENIFLQANERHEAFRLEYRLRRHDGEYRWMLDAASPWFNDDGEFKGYIGSVIDIHDRQQIEVALQQKIQEAEADKQILDALMEYIPEGITIADAPDVMIRQVSRYGQQLIGRSPEVIEGIPAEKHVQVWDIFCTDGVTPATAEALPLTRAVQQGEVITNEEWVVRKPDGQKLVLLCNAGPIYNSNGEITGGIVAWRDISDRKQVELERQRSEAIIQAFMAASPIALALFDRELRFLYANEALAKINEFPLNEQLGRTLWESLPQIASQFAPLLLKVMETQQPVLNLEFNGELRPGVFRHTIANHYPVCLPNGEAIGVGVAVMEISELTQAQEKLKESEERFRTLADNISQFAWMADNKGQIFWYNQRWFDYTGIPLEEIQSKVSSQVLHPDQLERVNKKFYDCIETGQTWEDTFLLRGKDGEYRWFLSRAIPVRDEGGKVLRWFGTNTDITDRQQAEAALRESENRLRLALESAELGTWDFNPITEVLRWDEQCKAMFGLPPAAEVTYDIFLAGLHPEDRDRTHEVVLRSFNPESGGEYDIEYRTVGIEDGVERWIAAKGKAFFNSEGVVIRFIGTVLNITQKKLAEAQREELLQREQAAREAAEQANRIKDDFLAVLSHELRSPLSPILAWTKLLQTRKLSETKTADALAAIERNVKLQTQLIDDLLDIAKILRGKLSLNVTCVNLKFIIQAALDTVRTAAVAKSISLNPVLLNIGQVSGDSARLQQIVWNLLSNAIKFTPKGGQVDIQLQKVANQAEITVTDTGKGISSDFLPYIFESFRQEDNSITRKYGGLGLGLAIVRQLVEAHGGTIKADSLGEGLGATFTVRLPLLNVEPEINYQQELLPQELTLTGVRVLAVDDDPDIRELLKVLFADYGAEVMVVKSAAQVLATIEYFQPDVLVSDIGMPEVDGYSLIEQIRALPSHQGGQVKAIALTAYARSDDRQRALNTGFHQHIAKPIDPEQLVQAVAALAQK
ncbi:MAG: PAS domain S-box protein [Nostoc sp. ChiSLP02]|nr:PAS domain S-box protein [Nostoc sp. DedSLP05]MDZ8100229.1 PAS domain S-box protein [Nostoc sp. DedSLP01]MDZ8183988.1 PAS domain S-box protein [Nostoc sp. ChiSLP02]